MEGPERKDRPRLLIVTGEASGDLHGAELAQSLWKCDRSLQILGMGGERMQKAGVRLVFDNRRLGVMGLVEVVARWKAVSEAFRAVGEWVQRGRIDLLVLIDSPDFNLRLAERAKREGIPVVYYIGPKLWAWRPGRIKTVARLIDKVLVIFPFEQAIYKSAGIPCRFVGNPLLDEIPQDMDPVYLRRQYGIDPRNPVVALLPGSRAQEVRRLLPVMLKAADRVSGQIPNVNYLIPVAPSIDREMIFRQASRRPIPVKLVAGEAPRVLACADAAVVASGTATLEAALVGTPMVIVYKMAWPSYLAARLLVRVRNVGLVNIVAGRPVVPELLQWRATGRAVGRQLLRLMRDHEARKEIKKALAQIRTQLGPTDASMRAAQEVLAVLGPRRSGPREDRRSSGD